MVSTRLPKIVREGKITNTEYSRRHHWVIKQLGKPMVCSNCHTTESKKYDWANLSGDYKLDLSDWMRLCQSCHRKLDLVGSFDRCRSGHIRSAENTYTYPSGYKKCKICRDIALRVSSTKVIMFGKLQALEGNKRATYLQTTPLKYVYVFKSRQQPLRNGSAIDPLTNKKWSSSTMAFAWFVWEKGYDGNPQIKWLDTA